MTTTATCKTCGSAFEYEPASLGKTTIAIRFAPGMCSSCAEVEAQRDAAQRRQERFADRNLPRRYVDATFDGFTVGTPSQQRALDVVRDHAADGVYLMGRAGCGKTHLAACAVADGPGGSLFVPVTELLDDIRAGFGGDGRGLYERALRAPLLALDDLGAEQVTDWVRDRLYNLLNARWNACLSLIVTTNVPPKLIAERIGDGAASRIAGLCRHRIEVQGPDGRRVDREYGAQVAP
ncbi:MAG TPA: ATP-binding protein [Coriobacteriia bacterium]|nr:ATP-binding protein [Coriobacteriia bacterium]